MTENWHPASLIPTTGIKGGQEQEMRATSATLAVLKAVPEFAKALLKSLGAPAGSIETFVEVPFEASDGRIIRPDGLIRISRGKRSWVCLVEVKTGKNVLDKEQLESYLDIARVNKFDALVTISNQFSPAVGVHPVKVNGNKLRSVKLFHFSWIALITQAVIQHEHRGVSDPDQAWILEELIKYLEHPNSGAMQFDDMGKHWVAIRNSVKDRSLRKSDTGLGEVVGRWIEFNRYLALQLAKHLGAEVRQVLTAKERGNPAIRTESLMSQVESSGCLTGLLRVPDAISDIQLVANLSNRTIESAVTLSAPSEGTPRSRVTWLLRQLRNAPDSTRIDVSFERRSNTVSNTLGLLREDPTIGLLDDRKINPRRFTVALPEDLGIKTGNGQGSFVNSVQVNLETFYREVVQNMSLWQQPAPKLPESEVVS
jgi:hypothetical protein